MPGYTTEYASLSRGSRVPTPARALSQFIRVAPLDGPPRSVLVAPRGDYVTIDHGAVYEVRSSDGAERFRAEKPEFGQISLLETSYLLSGYERTWEGKEGLVRLNAGASYDGVHLALAVGEEIGSYIVLSRATGGRSQGGWIKIPPRMSLGAVRFFLPAKTTSRLLWRENIDGVGCGAIDTGYRIAVALQKGQFLVIDGSRETPDGSGHRLVDVPLPFAAYDMSIVEGGYALLSVGGPIPDPRPYTDLERTLALQARRVEFPQSAPARWTTILHHLDAAGKQTWQAEIPFEIYEPPVDAGNGRIYALGNGVAAFDKTGKTLFVQPSPTPMFATAFHDGALALAAGHELRLLDRDGNIHQKFTTAEHEPITTPPAIAADGSIWVATTKALYHAR